MSEYLERGTWMFYLTDEMKAQPEEKKKLLVIDDDPSFLFGLSRTLMMLGYEVISTSNGINGIHMAQSDLPDLIILDVNLPKMTGFQVKMVLNRLPATQFIPVVFVSAINERGTVLNGLNLADDYIPKPFDPEILAARVRTILRRVDIGYRQAVRKISAGAAASIPEKYQEWGQSVEMYDAGTAGHTLRVTSWAVALARSLGMPEAEIEKLRKGAMLHDIGKLAISDEILNKPGPLSREEWQVVRQHPLNGYTMLANLEGLQDALDIPRYHHERWDGQGYPDKLSGKEIPLVARIFSVIDVYDALLSKRPYKDVILEADVLQMIRNERGKHFDPDITDHFLENFNSIKGEAAHGYKKNNSCD